jgi:hypothetical protein
VTVASNTGADKTRVSRRPPATVIALGLILTLLIVGAIQGGLAMVINPIDPLGMSLEFLDKAPVEDYFWPGVFLLSIAVASAITTIGLFVRWDWRWAAGIEGAIGYRWPWIGAMSVGIVLLAFETIELFVVPFHPVMHPLLIAVSLAIVILDSTPPVRDHLSVTKGPSPLSARPGGSLNRSQV